MEKICSCYRPFNTWNPWRRVCDRCLDQRRQRGAAHQIVLLDTASTEVEARIWKDLLDQAGLPSIVKAARVAGITYRDLAQDVGQGYEVHVFQRDLEAAWQVVHGDGAEESRREDGF